jgi:hypothetical protein
LESLATRSVSSVHTVGSTSPVLLASGNQDRNSAVIHNESGVLFVALASSVSSSSYAYRLTGNSTLEIDGYLGPISGIKASGATSVFITEII